MVRQSKANRSLEVLGLILLLGGGLLGEGVLGGCRAADPEPYRIQVVSIDPHGGPALPEDRVHAIMRRSLERAPSYSPAERDQRSGARGRNDSLAATLEYRELPDATDHGRDLMVRLHVHTPERLAERLGPSGLDITVLLEREAGQADLAADLQLATDRVTTILQARTDLALEADGVVDRLLDSDDPELVILTLEWIRDHGQSRQAQGSADHVAELINHHDEDVGLLAIETIGRIGGPQHVTAVLERIQLSNSPQVSRAYEAIAQLGGPEAEGFLEFAARNEDEPARRAVAERALRHVEDAGNGSYGPENEDLGRTRDPRRQHRGHR